MASKRYGKTDAANCPICGIVVLKNDAYLSEGRTVISPRNANKKVSPDRFFCKECWAAGEYKQFTARVRNTAELLQDMRLLTEQEAFEQAFARCLAAEIAARKR
jgi:hypothetical protein